MKFRKKTELFLNLFTLIPFRLLFINSCHVPPAWRCKGPQVSRVRCCFMGGSFKPTVLSEAVHSHVNSAAVLITTGRLRFPRNGTAGFMSSAVLVQELLQRKKPIEKYAVEQLSGVLKYNGKKPVCSAVMLCSF